MTGSTMIVLAAIFCLYLGALGQILTARRNPEAYISPLRHDSSSSAPLNLFFSALLAGLLAHLLDGITNITLVLTLLAVQTAGLLGLTIVEHHYFPSRVPLTRFRTLLGVYGIALLSCIAILLLRL